MNLNNQGDKADNVLWYYVMIRRLEDRLEKGKQFVYMIQESMLATEDRKTELYFMELHGENY